MSASLSAEELEIHLEIRDPDEWSEDAAAWDFAIWDGEGAENEWTNEEAGWIDAVCDARGFIIERGRQTNWDDILAAHVELELDNSSGRYSVYGSLAWPRIRPGFGIKIYGTHLNSPTQPPPRWCLFNGNVTEYREPETPGDTKIVIKAVDAFNWLNDPISVDYNPGVPQEPAGYRIHGLLNRSSLTAPRNIALGIATMTNYRTTRSLLDEIQVTAMSDGGVFFIDNDGTIVYLDRTRILGRKPQYGQEIASFSDSCNGPLPYAAVEPIIGDSEFGNVIIVTNVSQGTDSPHSGKAVDEESITLNGRFVWSPEQLVICNANYVQSLADFQLLRRSTAFYHINSFEAYPIHDERIWDALLPLRVGDVVFVERTPPFSETIFAPMLCDGLRIEATPDMWKFVVRCSPGDSVKVENTWDFDVWDTATWQ